LDRRPASPRLKNVAAGLFLTLLGGEAAPPAPAPLPEPQTTIVLRDVSAGSGVSIRFENGTRGRHDLPEIMGGGLAMIDADGDGRLDLFFCNGGPITADPQPPDDGSPCRLYRNLGDFRFEDVTTTAGAPGPSYAMGAAVADYDGDGRDDLFVTGWRDQRLYRNVGGGQFVDVTARAGLSSNLWSTSAAWADLDGDGDLDLFVANYLDYEVATAPYCASPDGRRDYCGPESFAGQPDRLYRNNGDGTFTDVSHSAGVDLADGRGLGVLVADLVGDARPDVFVANDGSACRLFENLGGLRFRELGEATGLAVDGQGEALAGMGVAVGDLDGNGKPDLVVGNFLGRSTVGFLNQGDDRYLDASRPLGLAAATRGVLGFGLALVDFDGDGWLDLFQANGHVLDRARLGTPFAMRPTLLHNVGGRLEDATAGAGAWSTRPVLGRGLAVGDLDGDGRPDVVLTALDAPPTLLRNGSKARPVVLELVGRSPKARAPFAARVRARLDGRLVVRDLIGGGSYLSASEARVFLPTVSAPRIESVEVSWPSGRTESWRDLPASGTVRLLEGTGKP
jgi:hypothetical protein